MTESNQSPFRLPQLPPPRGLSERAQELLLQFYALAAGGDDLPEMKPDPADHVAWRAHVLAMNTALLENSSTPMYSVAEREGISSESTQIAGVDVHIATPDAARMRFPGRVYLEMHGGALCFLKGEGARRNSLYEAERLGVKVVSIDYRVPPDGPYPAALDDCLAVYRETVASYDPADIVIGGVSGGGNLAAALPLRIRAESLPLPAALILLTPEVDLTESGDTVATLDGVNLTEEIRAYALDHDVTDPYLSPLFADFTLGYPSTFLQSGTRDMFLSNTVRMDRALKKAGVPSELNIWDGMPHVGFGDAPEDREVSDAMVSFLSRHWR